MIKRPYRKPTYKAALLPLLIGAGFTLCPAVSMAAIRTCIQSQTTNAKMSGTPDQLVDSNQTETTNQDCGTYEVQSPFTLTVGANGYTGNVIMDNGSTLVVGNQGGVNGIILAGGTLKPDDFGNPPAAAYGGNGTVTVLGGATVRGISVGGTSSVTVGDNSGNQAHIGWIHTNGGTTTVTNTTFDPSLYVGTTSNQVLGSLTVEGGNLSVSDSTINGQGFGNSSIFVGRYLAGAPATPITLSLDRTHIYGYDTLYIAPKAGDAPIVVNVTDSDTKAEVPTGHTNYGQGITVNSAADTSVTVTATGSQFAGSLGALFQAGKNTQVSATNSTFTATGLGTSLINNSLTGMGMAIRGGVSVTLDHSTVDSTVAGGVQGIYIDTLPTAQDDTTLILQNQSAVSSGANSPAIEVRNTFGQPYKANILIASGSTLTAGNNVILQADSAGVANVTADNVALTGNSVVQDAGSQLNIGLRNNATMLGDFTSTAGGSLSVGAADATAVFAVTGNVTADAASATVALGANGVLNGNVVAQNQSQLTVQGSGSNARLNGAVNVDGSTANIGLSNGARLSGAITANNSTVNVGLSSGAQALGGLALTNGATGTQVVVDGAGSMLSNGSGPAIAVDGTGTSANIYLQNGGRLDAAAGNPLINVTNAALANVTLDNTTQTGDMTQDATARLNVTLQNNANLTGNLATTSLAVNTGATWNMGSQTNQSVGALTMGGGTIDFNSGTGPFKTLTASSLNGGGTFNMGVDFAPGTGNDQLVVNGQANGTHAINANAEDQGVENPRNNIPMVLTQGGNGQFAIAGAGGKVDAGIYTYTLQKSGDNWYLVRSGQDPVNPVDPPNPPTPPTPPAPPAPDDLSPAAKTALSMSAALPYVFYGELGTLRQRQGDLRMNKTDSGLWARSYSTFNQLAQSSAPPFQLNQYGGAIGADKRLLLSSGDLYVGGFGSYSYNTLDIDGGSTGRINSYGGGAYATWMMNNGWYLDSVLKANNFDNELHVIGSNGGNSRGKYSTPGVGGSIELGKHIDIGNKGFIEPYMQWAGFVARSANETMDSNFRMHYSPTKSVQGQLGMLAGSNIELKNGVIVQPYIKGAVIREFINNNKVTLNGTEFTQDMSGNRVLVGLGVATQLKPNLQVHLDTEYSTGGPVNNSVNINLGVRYAF